ncbi:MAG: CoA pyrophosphatase [Anaerolineales bacterium]|nr:CoA pyrophosphatase [Anaerolineales bacterium]
MDRFENCSKTELSNFLRNALSRCSAKSALHQRDFSFPTPPTLAAILVPVLLMENQWCLLFIRRSTSNDPHSGQVAFPGGRMESEDSSPETAALREAQEEIGLLPNDVELLGRLPALLTVTNYLIQPIVGIIPYPYPFQPSPSEVQKIFTIPLNWLANPFHYHIEERTLPPPVGKLPTIYYKPFQGEVLWGASAQIVHTFLSVIQNQAPPAEDEA